MKDYGPAEITDGMHTYSVAQEGIAAMKTQNPKPPKLTAGQKRYCDFLNEDCSLSFGEWLKWQTKAQKNPVESHLVP